MIRINLWHHWFSLYKLRDFENTHLNTDHHSRTSLVYPTIILRKSTREFKWPTTVSTVNIQSEQNNRGSNATAALNGTTELATLAFPTAISCCRSRKSWNSMVLSAVSSRSSSRKLTSVRGVRCLRPVKLHFGVGGVQSSTRVIRPVHDLRSPSPGMSYTLSVLAHLTGIRPCILWFV